ncbi:unnamed protein product [Heterobilharzia americana]|nr:unnamed protein product [Heterobilharzia americana]
MVFMCKKCIYLRICLQIELLIQLEIITNSMPEMETYTHSLNEEIKSDEGILSSNLIMLRSRGENLKFITKLNLWGLKLRNISMVKSMPNLKVINMSGNCLNSLEPFTNCFNLCELYVRNNQIVNINEVAYLKYLSKFEKLWLTGNPCCQFFRINEKNDTIPCNSSVVYRYTVIRNLQFLIHLDQAAITSEERELSEKYGVLLTAPPPCPSLSSISTELSIGEQYPSETSENKLNDINNEGDNESNNTHSVVDITLSSDVEMKKSENGLSSLSNYTKQLSTNMLNINFLRESKSINENTVSINDSIHSQSSCNKRNVRIDYVYKM